MKTITITIDGIERIYQGDIDQLHSIDWEAKMYDLIESANEA